MIWRIYKMFSYSAHSYAQLDSIVEGAIQTITEW